MATRPENMRSRLPSGRGRMGGLLGGGMGQGAGAAPVGFDGDEDPDQKPNVTEDEQRQYNMVVENGMQLLYTPNGTVAPDILTKLSTGNKPIEALANTAVSVVMMLEQSARTNGMNIEDDVLMHAGREIFEQIADIAEAADIHDYNQAELQGAWYTALDLYREANSDEGGRFNPEQASREFEMLNEADKEGRANEVLPGFEQNAERAFSLAMADQNELPDDDDGEDEE